MSRRRVVDILEARSSRSACPALFRQRKAGAPGWLAAGDTMVSPPPPMGHAALIQAIAVGQDRDAFAMLFRYFAPRVKAWLLRRGLSGEVADELAQETLLIVWRKAAVFDPARAGVSTWIFTIARNLSIDGQRRDRPSEALPDLENEMDSAPRADAILAESERDGRIRLALDTLSPEQAEVVQLAFFMDKPHAEIERDLGIPLGTVKSRLRLAMRRLRAALEDFA